MDEIQNKLKEAGFEQSLEFNEKAFSFVLTDTFTSAILLEELEADTSKENMRMVKKCLNRLKPLLAELKPTLKLH